MRVLSRLHRNICVALLFIFLLINVWATYHISDQYESISTTFLAPQSLSTWQVRSKNRTRGGGDGSYRAFNTSIVHPLPQRRITNHACDGGYRGVLHIRMGDIGGAAGTIFFQFVVGQLIYAEQYQLMPFIHFDNVSNVIYDPVVHGSGPGVHAKFKGVGSAVDIVRPNGHWRDRIPGPPRFTNTSAYQHYHFEGTGVWDHYFQPVSDFVPGDASCEEKPYLTLTLKQITPGIHGFVSWAPRCWRYHYLPDYITKPHVPLHEWLRPSQLLGAAAVDRYIRFQPHIIQAAARANPHCVGKNMTKCMGLHIRHSDKAAGRRQIPVAEFLPFALAFVHAGGEYIYLATDSTLVLDEIAEKWPIGVRKRIRSLGDESDPTKVVRSSDEQAVFDIAAHHRTNQEILVEIVALAMCRFMVHGLSAVSESSIWLNDKLITSSVDLEDPDHLNPAMFETLVQMVLRGEGDDNPQILPKPPPSNKWWRNRQGKLQEPDTNTVHDDSVCDSAFHGILRIASTGGDQKEVGMSFFTAVINQIIYAEKHNWRPWVHFEASPRSVVYDRWAHGYSNVTVLNTKDDHLIAMDPENGVPGMPQRIGEKSSIVTTRELIGNGIWPSYFEPINGFDPQLSSCSSGLSMVQMSDKAVVSILSEAPWAVRAWRYDDVSPDVWTTSQSSSRKEFFKPMRRKGHEIVKKNFRFRPYLIARADRVNPAPPDEVCLSVQMRNGAKRGKYRQRVGSKVFLPYFEEFVKAGGKRIFIATDSSRALQYMYKNFPPNVTNAIRTQGDQVVRTSKEWPLHMIDSHHRVNSEALVDIISLSRCQFMIHTSSSISEAAIYLNYDLHINSINLEDEESMPPSGFGDVIRGLVERTAQEALAAKEERVTKDGVIVETRLENAEILSRAVDRKCRKNALVYLAQKKHSSYAGRDSYAILLQSLDMAAKNYLSINNHIENLDIFIFHTDDFTKEDLETLEKRLGPSAKGVIRLVNLSGSPFWQRPAHHSNDNPNSWYAYPLFSEGYRRMMHWFAIDIWKFFAQLNEQSQCSYRYIFRLDEDSFIHSPIRYDIFGFMESKRYVYGYRLCTYEMQVTRRMWTLYHKRNQDFHPHREVDLEMCAFYNNFFVADLQFFLSPPVQKFLNFIDRQGQIYRRRLGDLMIHTMSVYAFAEPGQIHRFLDFTYEHGTVNQTSGCLVWGGIQAGYNDENASTVMSQFYQERVLDRNCVGNSTFMVHEDLSPTYSHIPEDLRSSLALHTITAGRVEFPLGKGILSG